tara:strand:- start:6187 stop:6801 length:615 start_codon:yes stop_codon:yes gene_type:complete
MANAFRPDTLKSVIANRGGLATTEKFEVVFSDIPSALDGNVNKDLQFLCENVALPTKSLSAGEKSIYGVTYQMPYKVAYQELSMTFYLTEDMAQKKFFDEWQNKIIDPNTGNLNYYDTYACKMLIRKHNKISSDFGAQVPYEITLEGAWPSIVAEVQLSHGGGNEVARLPVTIQYKRWLSGNITGNVGQRPAVSNAMFDPTSVG